jgi:hypothetical protein
MKHPFSAGQHRREAWRQWVLALVPALLLGSGLACQTIMGSAATPTPGAGVRQAWTGFQQAGSDEQAAFDSLRGGLEQDPSGMHAYALEILSSNSASDERMAAVYVLSETGLDGQAMDALHRSLDEGGVDERLLAAETLLLSGDPAGFPTLIALLGSQEALAYRDPPQQAWQAASFALIQLTDEDLGLIGPEEYAVVSAAQPAWQAWWESKRGGAWDEDQGVYR